jgi:hypothetical protein
MLTFSQKGFKFQLPISDNEIWCIGMIACQWSSLEDLIDNFIAHVNNGPALTSNGAPMSFNSRVKLVKEIITNKILEPSIRDSFLLIVNRIHSMQDERDKVIHHIWSDTNGTKTIFDWRKKSKISERKMDAVKLRNLAVRIEASKLDFLEFLINNGKVKPGQPLFETAWLNISQHA